MHVLTVNVDKSPYHSSRPEKANKGPSFDQAHYQPRASRGIISEMLREIRQLFERLVAELPPGAASVNMTPVTKGRGTVVEILSANPRSADFGVHCDESDIFSFSFGKVSGWEWPYERRYRYDEKDTLTEVEEMSRAIIAGNCEETRRWFSRTGRIFVEGYTYKMTDVPKVPRPPLGTIRYAPYVGDRALNHLT